MVNPSSSPTAPAALQLSLSGPYFSSLAIKKVQGTSSGVGITTVRACEVGTAFWVPKCGNWESSDATLLQ